MNTPSNITSASATEAKHARPHLETHTRGQNHSAVAGAAYRLGMKLYDERAGVWHDFRKRALGEEIVLALTVAPPGAPSWATDAAQLWNRVELAEKRKDAQLARDYRIPIPFGLTDQYASAMAEDMARYISRELHTPVSIGLHRDADRDALGMVKPKDKQGFHAHLYFPTRKLADTKSVGEGDSGDASGFGPKLTMLSNKRTSVVFVEALNERWARLANQYTSSMGLPADYDHRSYTRMGVDLIPQITLGQAVTAMERKGTPTWKAEALKITKGIEVPPRGIPAMLGMDAAHPILFHPPERFSESGGAKKAASSDQPTRPSSFGDTVEAEKTQAVMADVFELAHRVTAEAQRAQETTNRSKEALRRPRSQANTPPNDVGSTSWQNTRERSQFKPYSAGTFKPTLTRAARGGRMRVDRPDSLVARLRASGPVPKTDSEREALERALLLVQIIERFFATFDAFLKDQERLGKAYERAVAHSLDSSYQLDISRSSRSRVRRQAKAWDQAHPWQAKVRTLTGTAHAPRQQLDEAWRRHDEHVQSLKGSIKAQAQEISVVEQQLSAVNREKTVLERRLGSAVVKLKERDANLFDRFQANLPSNDRNILLSVALSERVIEEGFPAEAMAQNDTPRRTLSM